METIDPREAAAQLDAAADAARSIRDIPWPAWLYPANALLLGGLALDNLVRPSILAAILALVLAVGFVAINYWAGRRIGAPFAIPTSAGFRILAAVAAVFVLASLFTREFDTPWPTIACAVGAVTSYSIGSVLHWRSTHR